jgi:flagellar biosynthetic protein FliR
LGAPIINASEFAGFVLVLLRLSLAIAVSPIFGSANFATEAKIALALTLTFVIAPMVTIEPNLMPMHLFGFVYLAIGEILVGLVMGFMVRLVVEAANLAGEYLSFQMGMTMVNLMDPMTGAQVPVVSRLIYIIFTLLLLYLNGHLLVLKAAVDSFKVAPPGLLYIWGPEMFTEVMLATGRMYVLAVKIAAPVVGLLFCCKVSFGIIAKAVPQMQVLFVGMPLYILVGLGLIGISMDFWPRLIEAGLLEAQEAILKSLRFLAPRVP